MKSSIFMLPSSDPIDTLRSALDRIRILEAEVLKLQPTLIQSEKSIRVFHLGRLIRIALSRVLFFKAESNYTRIYLTDGQQYYVSRTLKSWTDEICNTRFIRCHRSYLINHNEVEELNRASGEIRLTSGIIVPTSRRFQKTSIRSIFQSSSKPSHLPTAKPECAVHKLSIKSPLKCN
ncbi:MAG TPA: LytTR family DNA-binding domain-containing protein [Saprospiraceae bacterium]